MSGLADRLESSPLAGVARDPMLRDDAVLDLRLLGPPVVSCGQREIALRTRKAFALLVYLTLTRVPHARERLATLLWPDHAPEAARTLLRTTLSQLRRQLGAAGSKPAAAVTMLRTGRDVLGREVIGVARDGVPLLRVDVELLEMAGSQPGAPDVAAETAGLFWAAVESYRGPFLEGVVFDDAPELEEWVVSQRVRWQEQVENIYERLTVLQLGQRAFTEAATTARRWLTVNWVSEPGYRVLMRALASAGDRAGALAAYEECRAMLEAELAVEPAPETVALVERLRRLPASQMQAPSMPSRLATGLRPHHEDLPFVGRKHEFAMLVEAYQAARRGEVQVVVIEGEAGIGKTRLAQELLRWAALKGADVLQSRGDEARGRLPYQLLVDALRPRLARENAPEDLVADVWLTELARLFPELYERYPDLRGRGTGAGEDMAGQARLFEAVFQLTLALAERARTEPLAVLYDDGHFIAQASRDLLLYLLPRHHEARSPHLLLLTTRSEELAVSSELEGWLADLARQVPTTRLVLAPLTQDESEQAVAAVVTGAPDLGRWLYSQTEGQPFYLVETLNTLVDQGILVLHESAADSGQHPHFTLSHGIDRLPRLVPGTVHQLIRGQLGGVRAAAREALTAVAVLGTEATFERVCDVAGLTEQAGLAALDELRARRFIVERGGSWSETLEPARYEFPHDLVREVVYTEAGDTRRRIFHRRAFTALERSAAAPAELARHALVAGLIEPAFRFSIAAGDEAVAVYAVRDALTHYERAWHLLNELFGESAGTDRHGLDAADSEAPEIRRSARPEIERLYLHMGQAYEWIGAWEQARTVHTALRAYARQVGSRTLEALALMHLANIVREQSWNLRMARTLAEEAVRVAESMEMEEADQAVLAEALWKLAQISHMTGDFEMARDAGMRGLELARAANHRVLIALILKARADMAGLVGDWNEAVAAAEEGRDRFGALAEEAQARRARGLTPRPTATRTPNATPADEPLDRQAEVAPLLTFAAPPATTAGYRMLEALCLQTSALYKLCRGDLHAGIEDARHAQQLARSANNAHILANGSYVLAPGLIDIGAYEEAVTISHEGLKQALISGDAMAGLLARFGLSVVLHSLFRVEDALVVLHEAEALADQIGIQAVRIHSWALLCVNHALADDWTAAGEAAERAVALRDAAQTRLNYLDFQRQYETEALLRAGKGDRARLDIAGLAERVHPTDSQDRRPRLVLLRMRAVLARFEGQVLEAIGHLEDAVGLAAGIGLPGEEWHSLAELAHLHRIAGNRSTAAAAQREAEAIVEALAARIADTELRTEFVRGSSTALRTPLV